MLPAVSPCRHSGLDCIDCLKWGTHICQFYQTKNDLLSILVPYFKAGLENNEYCMWITSPELETEEAWEGLKRALPGLKTYRDSGQIMVVPYQDWYLKGGFFDTDRVLNDWLDRLNFGIEKGYEGLRVTGNTAWLQDTRWSDFAAYERKVNKTIGDHNLVAICSYPLEQCTPHDLIEVVQGHQFALIKKNDVWMIMESSDKQRAEADLEKEKQTNVELTRLNDLKTEFISAVTHELRTPLAAISEAVHLVQDGIDGPVINDQLQTLDLCQKNIVRLSRLIETVLDFSKFDAHKIRLNPVEISLNEIALEAHALMQPMMTKKGLQFSLKLPDHDVIRKLDADKIRQVLFNLLDNAAKYTDSGQIFLSVEQSSGETRIVIQDTGIGIPPEDLPHIFESFYRSPTTGTRHTGGVGLGLALSAQIIHEHGGQIRAESRLAEGSRFTISFPPQNPSLH